MQHASNGQVPEWIKSVAIVGGCGHVGLPLGMAFARKGLPVLLVDSYSERVAMVNGGRMPFMENGADELLPLLISSGLLRATIDIAAIQQASAVVITIGTQSGESCAPSIEDFDRAMEGIIEQLRPSQLVALRSTVFPGVTERLARQLGQRGLEDVELAYCPERIMQGQSLLELAQLPQLVAGITSRAGHLAAELFGIICPTVIFLQPIEAELAKLFCNAYRYINFAVANQFRLISEKYEANFQRIYQAIRADYPRMAGLARAGFAAGPCLVKDTFQLAASCPGGFSLGQAALEINEGLPAMLIENLKRAHDLKNMCVGILGMAFKPNSDDPRNSLSYKLREVLLRECREVLCHDPHIQDPTFVPMAEIVDLADLLIVATPHDCYRECEFLQPVIDISGLLAQHHFSNAGLSRPEYFDKSERKQHVSP